MLSRPFPTLCLFLIWAVESLWALQERGSLWYFQLWIHSLCNAEIPWLRPVCFSISREGFRVEAASLNTSLISCLFLFWKVFIPVSPSRSPLRVWHHTGGQELTETCNYDSSSIPGPVFGPHTPPGVTPEHIGVCLENQSVNQPDKLADADWPLSGFPGVTLTAAASRLFPPQLQGYGRQEVHGVRKCLLGRRRRRWLFVSLETLPLSQPRLVVWGTDEEEQSDFALWLFQFPHSMFTFSMQKSFFPPNSHGLGLATYGNLRGS